MIKEERRNCSPESGSLSGLIPDFAALHPGYSCLLFLIFSCSAFAYDSAPNLDEWMISGVRSCLKEIPKHANELWSSEVGPSADPGMDKIIIYSHDSLPVFSAAIIQSQPYPGSSSISCRIDKESDEVLSITYVIDDNLSKTVSTSNKYSTGSERLKEIESRLCEVQLDRYVVELKRFNKLYSQ